MSAAKRGGSLRLRLAVAGLALLAIACVMSFFGLSYLFERHVERRVATELELHLGQIIAKLDRDGEGRLRLLADPVDPRFTKPLSGLYWQIESKGEIVRSRSLWDGALETPALEPGSPVIRDATGPAGRRLFMAAREIVGGERLGPDPVLVAVAIDRADIDAATQEFRADMAPFLALLAALLMVANLIQIQLGLLPLSAVRRKVAEIRAGLAQRMGAAYPLEIQPLTEEVDELLASREAQLVKARSQAADLAHGLKTPLQALAGDVARLRAEGRGQLADEIELSIAAMRRHVDHQLARARLADRGQARPVSVLGVANRVIAVLERTPRGQLLDWMIEVEEKDRARIEAEDLAELLGNLLENATRYARDGIKISTRREGDLLALDIRDDGPGIPAERLADVVDRGGRLDTTSGGAGLGLAIVGDIVAANKGEIAFANAEPGLLVTVRLPAG
ncbi:signal transduction histidine kinase [Rhizobium sp. SG_E_25_P2]|uniref:sensor histidine kinase n=1 Tax=Rhizobium sp. SG_E_25_P2 TaxID=2879942 RepID=UPI002476078F|nr:HAMP domain-containing sensor histidine kinase [Rhizobium sp. SG_E_25_P2]MDH6267024.1 signal transduction histidine kinase [Rhizobium sp. SG_E_25_P2]